MIVRHCLLILLFLTPVLSEAQTGPCTDALCVNKGDFSNLYQISEKLYRSEQPENNDWQVLNEYHVSTVINLRHRDTNAGASAGNIRRIHLPMRAGKIETEKVAECLRIINASEGKVLIHCLHGSDRTGCVVACYRMAYCGWTREQAIEEFLQEKFGYHRFWFPGILKFLEKVNINDLKKE